MDQKTLSILVVIAFSACGINAAVLPPETFNSCCPIFLAPPPDSGLVKRELSYPCIDVFPNGEITEGSDRCVIKHECRTDEDCGNGRKCCYSGGIQGLPFKCFTPVSCRFGK